MSNTDETSILNLNALRVSQIHPKQFANLSRKNVNKINSQVVADYIFSSEASTLQSLSLKDNEIGDKGGEQICIALSSSQYCNLKSLDLSSTGILSITTIRILGEYLVSSSSTQLSKLNLSGNNIGDSEMQILCSGLSINTTLSFLKLNRCNIGDVGALTLLFLITNYNISLSQIKLDGNNINQQLQKQIYDLTESKNRFNIREYIAPQIRSQQSECNRYISEIYSISKTLQINNINSDIPHHILSTFQLKEYLTTLKLKKDLAINDDQIPKILKNSLNDQISYLNELKRAKESTSKVTLMVLGEEGVGKTSFIQYLLGDKWVGDQFKGYNYSHNERILRDRITDGIDIHYYQPEDKDFIISIYDFAGQEIYNPTHSFVLSSKAIYLLLFDASKSLNSNRIAHWLHTISYVAPGASIFLVGTHFDSPSALSNLSSTQHQLTSLIDNIQFLSRRDRSLRIITPTSFASIKISEMIVDKLISANVDINRLSLWPISSIPSFVEKITSTWMISELIQSITLKAEKTNSLKKTIVPSSWLSFRSILLGSSTELIYKLDIYKNFASIAANNNNANNNDNNDNTIRISNIEQLYEDGNYKLGIMRENDLIAYGHNLFGFSQHEVEDFLGLLEYWGEIIIIPPTTSSLDTKSVQSRRGGIIILKPAFLISLCKYIISAKKLTSAYFKSIRNVSSIFRTFSRTSKNNRNPHLLDIDDIQNYIHQNIPNLNEASLKLVLHQNVLPILLELRLIYPVITHPGTYLIPDMLQNSSSLGELFKFLQTKNFNQKKVELSIRREYEFIYLPAGMFTRLMTEIWDYFSLIPSFSKNIHSMDMFWKDGFIITDCPEPRRLSYSTFNYEKYQICIIRLSQGRSIIVEVSSPIEKVRVILPIIHRAIINVIIQPLELKTGKQSHILCAAITPVHRTLPPPSYEYYSCFGALLPSAKNIETPPMELFPFLIPEYYHPENRINPVVSSFRYDTEVQEQKQFGDDFFKGLWHNRFEVGIKKFNSEEKRVILNEISLLLSLRHPNIIAILDAYLLQSSLAIITEHCEEGNLYQMINSNEEIHPIIVCSIVRDIAAGISFLHNHSPPIIHGDIHSSTIFIKSVQLQQDEVCAKIGDIVNVRIGDLFSRSADIVSITNIISILSNYLLNTSNDKFAEELLFQFEYKDEYTKLKSSIISKFQQIILNIREHNFVIDMQNIADSLSREIIAPFYNNNTYNDTQFWLLDERRNHIMTILSRSTLFSKYQTLVFESNSDNAESLLDRCISLLRTEPKTKSNKYWKAICTYVIPVIGNAIEYHVFRQNHLFQLEEICYYFDKKGDLEHGFTLFHYACLSANIELAELLFAKSCSDINQCTTSAAIHLAISSLNHQCNEKGGIEATTKLLDFIILSQHANINLCDRKGETALFKAAMEGSFQLIVLLLNYPQSVDIHTVSKKGITAIVAAARYTPRLSEEGNFCIKELLQMGSRYSRSLSESISIDELQRIREIATQLINDQYTLFARYPHSTLAIKSWLSNDSSYNAPLSSISRATNSDISHRDDLNSGVKNINSTSAQPKNTSTNFTDGNDRPREKSIEQLQSKNVLLRRKLSSALSHIADFRSKIETIKMIERELEQKIIANFKTITNEIEWKVNVDYKIFDRIGKGSNNIGVYTIQTSAQIIDDHYHQSHYYAMKIVQSLISPELKDLMNKNPHHRNNHVRSLQYSEYWVPTSIFHPLIIQYVNYWIESISENSLIAQHCPQIMNMQMIAEDALISHTSFLVMRLYSTTLTSYFASSGVNKFGIERKWKEISYVIVQLMEVLLHFSQHYVVHGDFRGDNILLKLPSSHPLRSTHQFPDNNNNNNNNDDDDGNNKDVVEEDDELQIGVTDFGFAKCQCNKSITQNIKSLIDQINSLNQRYIPPELNKIQERYNDNNNDDNEEDDNNSSIIIINQATPLWNYVKAADIWSCGKMLLELFENNTGDIDQVLLSCSSDLEAITKLVNGCSSLPPTYRPLLLMLLTPDPEVRFNQRYYAYILSGLLCWIFFPVRSSNKHHDDDDDGDGGGGGNDGRVNLPSSIEELENVMEKIEMIREKKLEDAQSFLIKHPYSRCLSLILEYKFFCALSFFSPHQLKSLITSLITSQLEEK